MFDFLSSAAGAKDLFSLGGDILMWESQKDFSRENRAFQARREDTAVQRRVKDLIAAGLNPMLAYGGAAGSSASAQLPSGFQPSESMARSAQMKVASAQAANLNADTSVKNATALQIAEQTEVIKVTVPKILAEVDNIKSDTDLKKLQAQILAMDAVKLKAIIPELIRQERAKTAVMEIGRETVRSVNAHEKEFLNWLERIGQALGSAAWDMKESGVNPGMGIPEKSYGRRPNSVPPGTWIP